MAANPQYSLSDTSAFLVPISTLPTTGLPARNYVRLAGQSPGTHTGLHVHPRCFNSCLSPTRDGLLYSQYPSQMREWVSRTEESYKNTEMYHVLSPRTLLIPRSHQNPQSHLNPQCGHVLGTWRINLALPASRRIPLSPSRKFQDSILCIFSFRKKSGSRAYPRTRTKSHLPADFEI
jgi:hypothetical protein